MARIADTSTTRPALRALASPAASAPTRARTSASLQSAPFRPGELPLIAWAPLDRETRAFVSERSREAGLPAELWVRIATEASRLATEISSLTFEPREKVIAGLDRNAATPRQGAANLAAAELCRYAAQLRRGSLGGEPGEVLALRLPEEISGAWSAAAAGQRVDMPRWLAAALRSAPPECVAWEAAAAEGCRSLGEWAYAASLRASASARA